MEDKKKPLRVFEAFAGIGAQASALERIGIDHEIVGISDWFVDAIICYDAIHCDQNQIIEVPDIEEVKNYLNQYEFSITSVKPVELKQLSEERLKKLYVANKRTKNFGSITQIKGSELPDIDMLVYSFPCQDLSTGGKGLGMKKGSGTRSGLLWEIERILNELNEQNRLPEYLLLENVRNILAPIYREDLDNWRQFLTDLGYVNEEPLVLNALDFGIPQTRERCFIASHRGDPLNIKDKIQRVERKDNFFDFYKGDYTNVVLKAEADAAQLNRTPSREVMWTLNHKDIAASTIINTITCNMDRTNCAGLFEYSGVKGDTYRRPTIREAFLLMGFTEEEYERTLDLNLSYRRMNKLIGNSIVVNVLAAVFKAMLE